LLQGYAAGIFPMAESRQAPDLFWVEPRQRAILPIEGFHLSRSLAKRLRSGRFSVTCDRDFRGVLLGCADRPETWINATIEQAMLELHELGFAHSVEVWRAGKLVGGIYGVKLGRAFFGESMFSRETDASKVSLAWLVARLKVGEFTLLDCQFMTDHLASLGAVTVSRRRYVTLLAAALGSTAGSVAAGSVTPASELRGVDRREPPEFDALDRVLDEAGSAGDDGASGKFITQLLGHTS
jgi:leucyl/phenylalanyl-tRNA--protein transferase